MIKYKEEFIDAVLELSDKEESKLSEREREIFGLSSTRLRSLLNNLCSKDNTSYLELGVYRGATFISAIAGNKINKAVGVDSFTYEVRELKRFAPKGEIWYNMKSQLETNLDRFSSGSAPVFDSNKVTMINGDFREADFGKSLFNVVFMDVQPALEEHYTAFNEKIIPLLASESVVVFSGYSDENQAQLINKTIASLPSPYQVSWTRKRISSGMSDGTKYYSGVLIAGIYKNAK